MHERMEERGPAARGGRATVPEGERAREGGSLRGLGRWTAAHVRPINIGPKFVDRDDATRFAINRDGQALAASTMATKNQFQVADSRSATAAKVVTFSGRQTAEVPLEGDDGVRGAHARTLSFDSLDSQSFDNLSFDGSAVGSAPMSRSEIRLTNVRALMAQCGGPAEFGRRVGMSDSQVSQFAGKNPRRGIGNVVAGRIEQAFALPTGWLDRRQKTPPTSNSLETTDSDSATLTGYVTVPGFTPARADEFTLVPRLDARASCGGGADNGDHPVELEPLAFRNTWLRDKGARDPVVIDARGDSMSPFIVHGDVILFDRARTAVASGQIYLVQTPDGLRVKRVHKEFDGSITLRSDNPDKVRYPDERVPPELVQQLVVVGSFVWRGGG